MQVLVRKYSPEPVFNLDLLVELQGFDKTPTPVGAELYARLGTEVHALDFMAMERHSMYLRIGLLFDMEEVIAEVLDIIGQVTGQPITRVEEAS